MKSYKIMIVLSTLILAFDYCAAGVSASTTSSHAGDTYQLQCWQSGILIVNELDLYPVKTGVLSRKVKAGYILSFRRTNSKNIVELLIPNEGTLCLIKNSRSQN